MLKKVLLASAMTLAFSVPAMAQDAVAGCASCGIESGASSTASAKPIRLAQLEPRGAVLAPGPIGVPPHPQQYYYSCCDPKLNAIPMGSLWQFDAPNTTITSYGLRFMPNLNPAFQQAYDNTAAIVKMIGGLPDGFLVMHTEMRSSGTNGPTLTSAGLPSAWTTFGPAGTIKTGTYLLVGGIVPIYWEFSAPGISAGVATNWDVTAYNQANMLTATAGNPAVQTPANNMRPNNTPYVIRYTHMYYHWVGDKLFKVPVFCNNVRWKFSGHQINSQGLKMAPGQAPAVNGLSADAPVNPSDISVGRAVPVSAEEMRALPKAILNKRN